MSNYVDSAPPVLSDGVRSVCRVAPTVNTDDLVDSQDVAEILGLSHRNSVSTYLRRYADMPRPVVERGGGRTRLWLRQDVERWAGQRSR